MRAPPMASCGACASVASDPASWRPPTRTAAPPRQPACWRQAALEGPGAWLHRSVWHTRLWLRPARACRALRTSRPAPPCRPAPPRCPATCPSLSIHCVYPAAPPVALRPCAFCCTMLPHASCSLPPPTPALCPPTWSQSRSCQPRSLFCSSPSLSRPCCPPKMSAFRTPPKPVGSSSTLHSCERIACQHDARQCHHAVSIQPSWHMHTSQPAASLRGPRPGRHRLLLLLHQRAPPRLVWLPQHVLPSLRLGLLQAASLRHSRHALLRPGEQDMPPLYPPLHL